MTGVSGGWSSSGVAAGETDGGASLPTTSCIMNISYSLVERKTIVKVKSKTEPHNIGLSV